jgi:hypothetical protein
MGVVTMASVLWSENLESSSTLTLTESSNLQAANASTLIWERSENRWWREILVRTASEVRRHPVTLSTLETALTWLAQLPGGIPRPHIGVGDDGTMSVEWDRNGSHLHVMFEDSTGEVFYQDSNGDEWETSIDAGHDKIRAALRAIARA